MTERRSGITEEIAFPGAPRRPDVPVRLGRYEILAELGSGGMASVYLARLKGPAGFSKLFAIKRVHPHLAKDPLFVDMFLDEARIAAALQHPHVALVLELGVDEGEHFIAMEYLHGEHLGAIARAARAAGGMPIALAASVVARAAEGLHHAHEARDATGQALGVIHRDVTPANIFITYEGNVKLTDFGIAKAEGRVVRTETGTVKGKFAYMAPEQALGREIDRRVDVFALGVVLWELVAGERLFRGNTDAETLLAVALCEVVPPSTRRPECPPDLDSIIATCLARDPKERFETALAVATALDRVVETLGGARTRDIAELMHRLFAARILEREQWLHARAEGAPARGDDPVTHVSKKSRDRALAAEPDLTPSGTMSVSASMIMEREGSVVPLVSLRADPSGRAPSPRPESTETEAMRARPAEGAKRGSSRRTLGIVAAIAAVAGISLAVGLAMHYAATGDAPVPRLASPVGTPPVVAVSAALPPVPTDVPAERPIEPPPVPLTAAASSDAGSPTSRPSTPGPRRGHSRVSPRVAAPPPARITEAPPVAPTVDACPAGGSGTVDFTCGGGHWASVWVDGNPWPNEAPATRQRVPAGRHAFDFQIDGAGARRRVARCVRANESITIGCRE